MYNGDCSEKESYIRTAGGEQIDDEGMKKIRFFICRDKLGLL